MFSHRLLFHWRLYFDCSFILLYIFSRLFIFLLLDFFNRFFLLDFFININYFNSTRVFLLSIYIYIYLQIIHYIYIYMQYVYLVELYTLWFLSLKSMRRTHQHYFKALAYLFNLVCVLNFSFLNALLLQSTKSLIDTSLSNITPVAGSTLLDFFLTMPESPYIVLIGCNYARFYDLQRHLQNSN